MKLWHLILSFSFIVLIVLSFLRRQESIKSLRAERGNPEPLQTSFSYDSTLFLQAIAANQNQFLSKSQLVILPHHLLASPLIAKGVSLLNVKDPKSTIYILSPNHPNTGNCDIITSNLPWTTTLGQVDVDVPTYTSLLKSKDICQDDHAFLGEQGVATLLPYIKHFFPEAKIVPLIFKKKIELGKLNRVVDLISSSLPNQSSLFLSSIDFSHNLSSTEATEKDNQTKQFIAKNDYKKILTLSSEYLDSPPVLVVSLLLAQKNGLEEAELDHKNSADFNQNTSLVTSYFVYAFNKLDEQKDLTLLFGGDVMLGRTVNTQILKKADYLWPLAKISATTKQADLFMINLEGPFRSGCKPTDSGMIFCFDPKSVATLKDAGVDVVNLANNHIYNQGRDGYTETLDILNKNNIIPVGAPLAGALSLTDDQNIITIKNTKIAIIGFNDIPPYPKEISQLSEENLKKQILAMRPKVDLLVFTAHWGNEYSQRSKRQQQLAHLAIDLGVDAVIGAHPHWVQEFEEYKDKPIYYSLGNLVFDQMWSEETKKGLMVRLTYNNKILVKREDLPVKILDYGQPNFVL